MKKTLFTIVISLLFFSCDFNPKIEVENRNINLGKIPFKTQKSFYVKFKNIGLSDLSIFNIQTSCKCLIKPNFNKKIKPNTLDSIKLNYFANEKGKFIEKIVILTNAKKRIEIIKVNSEVE